MNQRADEPNPAIRVLLVEDSEINRELLCRRLVRRGYEVETAADGLAGYNSALGVDPDVVLMDMSLPEMDGWEVTARLREEAFERPIIGLTAHALTEDRQRALAAGCNAFITKPVDFEHLVESIEALAGREAVELEPAPVNLVVVADGLPPPQSIHHATAMDIAVAASLSEHAHALNNVRGAVLAAIGEDDGLANTLLRDADAAMARFAREWSLNAEALHQSDIGVHTSRTVADHLSEALGLAACEAAPAVFVRTDLPALAVAARVLCDVTDETTLSTAVCERGSVKNFSVSISPLSRALDPERSAVAALLKRLHITATADAQTRTLSIFLPTSLEKDDIG